VEVEGLPGVHLRVRLRVGRRRSGRGEEEWGKGEREGGEEGG
jgi:hypothetical protein